MRARSLLPLLLAAAVWPAVAADLPSPRVLSRYREMLATNPVEGTALERLWSAYVGAGQSANLLEEYRAQTTFAGRLIYGHLLVRAGRPADALLAYREAGQLEPTSPLPWLALGKLATAQNDFQNAAEAWSQALTALEAQPTAPSRDAQLIETLLALGSASLRAGRPEAAAAAWAKLLQREPQNLALRQRIAEEYLQARLPERAAEHLEYVATHAAPPERARAWQQLATVRQRAGQVDAASQALENGLALLGPTHWMRPELEAQLVRLYQRFQRVPELQARWEKAAAEQPRDVGALLRLANLYQTLGRLPEERAALQKLVELLPNSAEHRLRLARLLARENQIAPAAAEYDRLLAEAPNRPELVLERAELELRAGQTAAAETRVQQLLAREPGDDAIRTKVLGFFRENRLWERAEQLLREGAASGSEDGTLELANYLFSRQQWAQAEEVLRRLVRPEDAPATRAAALLQIATLLKGQSQMLAAARATAEALALPGLPENRKRDALLQLSELQLALGQTSEPLANLEAAAALSRTPEQWAETDQRLFDLYRQWEASGHRGPPESGSGTPTTGLATMGLAQFSPLLAGAEARLRAAAEKSQAAADWLRLARWQSWCQDSRGAEASITAALALEPKSIAAHELAVQLGNTTVPQISVRWHLERLAELDADRAAEYRRRLGQLEMQAGNYGEALSRFEALHQGAPADLETLTLLAQAQEAANQPERALDTWLQVYQQSPPARRRESLPALLRLYERAGRVENAAALLLEQAVRATAPEEWREHFQALLSFSQQHALLPWLQTQWEARRQQLVDDFPTELAYSEILRAGGRRAEALQVLSQALYLSPDPRAALPGLVREAEALHQSQLALEFQTQLVRLGPAEDLAAISRLAEMQEKAFLPAAARATWAEIAQRFPRQPQALGQAAEFAVRDGDLPRALGLWAAANALEAPGLPLLWRLSALEQERGNLAAAEEHLREILRRSEPQGLPELPRPAAVPESTLFQQPLATEPFQYGVIATTNSGVQPEAQQFWSADRGVGPGQYWRALRELSRLLQQRAETEPGSTGKERRAAWIQEWKQRSAPEPFAAAWVFFYTRATEELWPLLESLRAADPANLQLLQSTLWMAMELRQWARLGTWLQHPARTQLERDLFFTALGQLWQPAGSPAWQAALEPMLAGLFPPGARVRLWDMAELAAQRGAFAAALHLGQRALAVDEADHAARQLRMAGWHLALGQVREAQALFAEAAHHPGERFDTPPFFALWAAYLLLSPEERGAFAERFLREVPGTPPLPRVLAQLFLSGMRGQEAEARAAVQQLWELRPMLSLSAGEETVRGLVPRVPGSVRGWTYVLHGGSLLPAWRLPHLTIALWEAALADPTLLRLQGPQAQELAREVRAGLFALRIAAAPTAQVEDILAEYRMGDARPEGILPVAEVLTRLSANYAAVRLYRQAWEEDPGNQSIFRRLLLSLQAAEDTAALETVLQRASEQRIFAGNDQLRREVVLRLVDLLENRREFGSALAALRTGMEGAPYDSKLMEREARLLWAMGKRAESEEAWRRAIATAPKDAAPAVELAKLLEADGRREAALAALRASPGPAAARLRAQLCLRNKDAQGAIAALELITGPEFFTAIQFLAQSGALAVDPTSSRILLQAALARAGEPATIMPLQELLVRTFAGTADHEATRHEFRKLRRLAVENEALRPRYYDWLQAHAREVGLATEAASELRQAWQGGRGLPAAGVAYAKWLLAENAAPRAELGDVCRGLQQVANTSLAQLQDLTTALQNADELELAAELMAQQVATNPFDDTLLPRWIDLLCWQGATDRAAEVLTRWGARAHLSSTTAAQLAAQWQRLGRYAEADAWFTEALSSEMLLASPEPYQQHAAVALALEKPEAAVRPLRLSYRFPAGQGSAVLHQWLVATGKLTQWESAFAELEMSPEQAEQARRDLLRFCLREGRADDALSMLRARPELWSAAVALRLARVASETGRFAAAHELFTAAAAEAGADSGLPEAWALLLADWSDHLLATGDRAAALTHLRKAHELRADHFGIAKKLWRLLRAEAQPEQARHTLLQFIAVTRDSTERAQAERLLQQP